MRDDIRRIPIRESLTTRVLLAGCEKFPLFLTFVLSGLPLILSFNLNTFSLSVVIMSIILAVMGFSVSKFISRKDPYMFAIIWRHIHYKSFYPAHEGYPGKKYSKFSYNPIKNFESNSVVK